MNTNMVRWTSQNVKLYYAVMRVRRHFLLEDLVDLAQMNYSQCGSLWILFYMYSIFCTGKQLSRTFSFCLHDTVLS